MALCSIFFVLKIISSFRCNAMKRKLTHSVSIIKPIHNAQERRGAGNTSYVLIYLDPD